LHGQEETGRGGAARGRPAARRDEPPQRGACDVHLLEEAGGGGAPRGRLADCRAESAQLGSGDFHLLEEARRGGAPRGRPADRSGKSTHLLKEARCGGGPRRLADTRLEHGKVGRRRVAALEWALDVDRTFPSRRCGLELLHERCEPCHFGEEARRGGASVSRPADRLGEGRHLPDEARRGGAPGSRPADRLGEGRHPGLVRLALHVKEEPRRGGTSVSRPADRLGEGRHLPEEARRGGAPGSRPAERLGEGRHLPDEARRGGAPGSRPTDRLGEGRHPGLVRLALHVKEVTRRRGATRPGGRPCTDARLERGKVGRLRVSAVQWARQVDPA